MAIGTERWSALTGAGALREALNAAGWRVESSESTVKDHVTVIVDGYGPDPGTTVRGIWAWPAADPAAVRVRGIAPAPGTRALAPVDSIDAVISSIADFPPPPSAAE
ncbi:hypothetical protein AB0M43_37625 [Longispora sp. NPDC051575]|uniref:hypothetical protein n=1 Tax=Longispora sp. NPDC051575 TaxID=3154943 RepID=UPI0034139121